MDCDTADYSGEPRSTIFSSLASLVSSSACYCYTFLAYYLTHQHAISHFAAMALSPLLLVTLLYAAIRFVLWPVPLHSILAISRGEPQAVLGAAFAALKVGHPFWAVRKRLFLGERYECMPKRPHCLLQSVCYCLCEALSEHCACLCEHGVCVRAFVHALCSHRVFLCRYCFISSEEAVQKILLSPASFVRCAMPMATITSPHSILGAGGLSEVWSRLRPICEPFFEEAMFDKRTAAVTSHARAAVKHAALQQKATGARINWFQLMNRLVLESHLITLMGLEDIPPEGFMLPTATGERLAGDIFDDSLVHQADEALPTYSAEVASPIVNFLMERLALPPEQLGGMEAILRQAHKDGKITSLERVHNMLMFLIALAPSPAVFWTSVHVNRRPDLLKEVRHNLGKVDTMMCVEETLRMYAPVPIMLSRVVTETLDLSVGGSGRQHHLVKGDLVVIPTILLQNSSATWERADEYDPSRFSKAAKVKDSEVKDSKDHRRGTLDLGAKTDIFKGEALLHLHSSNPELRARAQQILALVEEAAEEEEETPLNRFRRAASNVRKQGTFGGGDDDVPSAEESKEPQHQADETKAHFFPFGFGKHKCLGRPYASWVTLAILETLFQSFDVTFDDPGGLFEDEHPFQSIRPHIYSFPRTEVYATVSMRHLDFADAARKVRDEVHRVRMMTAAARKAEAAQNAEVETTTAADSAAAAADAAAADAAAADAAAADADTGVSFEGKVGGEDGKGPPQSGE